MENKSTLSLEPPLLETWKTIKIGIGPKTPNDYRNELDKKGMRIDKWGDYVLDKVPFHTFPREKYVNLIRVSQKKLELETKITLESACLRGKEFGFGLISFEIARQLRLQYPDQPKNERLVMAMETILGPFGTRNSIDVSAGHWIEFFHNDPNQVLCISGDLIFCEKDD